MGDRPPAVAGEDRRDRRGLRLGVLDHEHPARVEELRRAPRARAPRRARRVRRRAPRRGRAGAPRGRPGSGRPERREGSRSDRDLASSSGRAVARSPKTGRGLSAPTSSTLRRVHGERLGRADRPVPRVRTSVAMARAIAPPPLPRSTAIGLGSTVARSASMAAAHLLRLGAGHEHARPDGQLEKPDAARPVTCCSGSRPTAPRDEGLEGCPRASSRAAPTTMRACTPPREVPITCPSSSSASTWGSDAGRPEPRHDLIATARRSRAPCAHPFIHEIECDARDRVRAPP